MTIHATPYESQPADSMRVVITGIGLVTPFGSDRETSWAGLQSGRSATRWIDELDGDDPSDRVVRTRVAGAAVPGVRDDDCDPVIAFALKAAREAVADAGLDVTGKSAERIGTVIGTSKGGLRSFQRAFADRFQHSAATDHGEQSAWLQFFPNMAAARFSQELGLRGPCLCPVAACATGLVCLQRGYELIRDGHCDAVLAGSSDASLLPSVVASFGRLGVTASDFTDPATACRPFDKTRSGFVIGEGAGMLLLERLDRAVSRGAEIYAEWLAGGTAAEAFHITRLEHDPQTLVRLIRDVLRRAGVCADEIDYCNLHGTATVRNDAYETAALKSALGESVETVSCSSLKGAIGHLLGAAGSVETAATVLAMRDGIVPPTVNLRHADDLCNLDFTPTILRRKPIKTALKLSLGFGGHLAAAVLRTL
ncbi:MAG: beta-ketoacyl-[acyl-carrier-protein] synthase family protein [Planctomycetes bacterium]|nr:beta-ketoacyl-[acyl-carrier-protein] synthase family protein [Planctomycetota bacterium]